MIERLSICVGVLVALTLNQFCAFVEGVNASGTHEESFRSHSPGYYFGHQSAVVGRQDSYLDAASSSATNFGAPASADHSGSSTGFSNSYSEPSDTYSSPMTGYAAPAPSYGTPMKAAYGPPPEMKAAYGPPPMKAYGSPLPTYGTPMKAYGTPMKAYGTPMKAYGTPMKGYGAPMMSGSYHYQVMPEMKGYGYGYGEEGDEEEKGGGKGGLGGLGGLAGLAGLAGLKGLLPLLPVLLGLLLALPFLPLLGLLLPIPVVTIPVQGRRNFVSSSARQFIDDFLSDRESCVERLSCEISNRITQKPIVKQNMKKAIQSLDQWLYANDTSVSHVTTKKDKLTEDSKTAKESEVTTGPFLKKLTRGLQDGMKSLPCSVYSKCHIFDSVKKAFAQFSEKYTTKVKP